MHAIWDAEESAATGKGAPCRLRQSDLADGVEGVKFFDPYKAILILQGSLFALRNIGAAKIINHIL
jgi:hypothetical protein